MKHFALMIAMACCLTPSGFAKFCFLCGSGSSGTCKDKNYCHPKQNRDTSAARKACKQKGCKISGTGSCPSSSSNYCTASTFKFPKESKAACSLEDPDPRQQPEIGSVVSYPRSQEE